MEIIYKKKRKGFLDSIILRIENRTFATCSRLDERTRGRKNVPKLKLRVGVNKNKFYWDYQSRVYNPSRDSAIIRGNHYLLN